MPGGGVARIDPATNRARVLSRRVDAGSLAVGGGSVWALGPWPYRAATIWQLDPRTGHIVRRIHVPADGLNAVVFGAGALWGTDSSGGNVWRIQIGQPGRPPTMRTVASAPGLAGIAFEPHGLWVTNPLDDTVSRIDPATNRVSRVIHLQAPPRDIAVGAGRVWVTLASADGQPAAGASTRTTAAGRHCAPRTPAQPMASAVAMACRLAACPGATTRPRRRTPGVVGPDDSDDAWVGGV